MGSFKEIAYQILKEAGRPMHSKEITKIALERGWLKTAGKTPEATMNAQLIVDINKKKEKSLFIKTAPSTFALRTTISPKQDILKEERAPKISLLIPTKQKGDIAEARITELITLYGSKSLVCYKPVSDVEGIDLIVKEKESLKTIFIQIKSRFGDNPDKIYTATTKAKSVIDNYSMAIIFCFFDTEEGDLWDYLWFVPAPDFIKKANKLDRGRLLGFVAGRTKRESNKWDQYLIDKKELANTIINQLKRL